LVSAIALLLQDYTSGVKTFGNKAQEMSIYFTSKHIKYQLTLQAKPFNLFSSNVSKQHDYHNILEIQHDKIVAPGK